MIKVDQRKTIRLIALFEAFKGIVVLLAASGMLSLLHKDIHEIAVRLVHHAHLDPASRYPQIFIIAADHLQDSRLLLLALGAAAYSAIRLAEAYGLYYEKAWAEVLAAGSGAVYVPMEVLSLMRHLTWLSAILFTINVLVVLVMVRALILRRRARIIEQA